MPGRAGLAGEMASDAALVNAAEPEAAKKHPARAFLGDDFGVITNS